MKGGEMESRIFPIFLLIQLILGIFVNCGESTDAVKATYSIVASAKLRPNMDYHVSATVHNVPSVVNITVAIEGSADDGNYNSISKVASLNPRETQILKFEVGEWSSGNYSLTVRGEGGLVFQNQTTLTFEPKSYSVFIQTDKAIYKPGQLVQFRVIVVTLYLLPSVTGAIDMFVADANGNRIKQWNRKFTSKGIVSAELLLSDKPVLGDWSVNVDVLGQTFKKSFTVAEYVLPTFEVEINLPPYVTFNKSDALASVKAKYTYGKPVKGELVLTVVPNMGTFHYTENSFTPFLTKTKIDGSKDIEVNIERDLKLLPSYYFHEILFTAVVEEELTGRKYNTSAILKMHDTDVKVELIKSSKTFKPGLKYSAFLKVAHHDDTPVIADNSELILSYGYTFNEKEMKTAAYAIPSNGLIKLEFFPPHQSDLNVLNLQVNLHNHTYFLGSVDAARSPSNSFIQVTLITENPQMDSDVELEVNATEPLSHLVIEVIGRGGIVFASTFRIPNKTSYRLKFPVAHTMAPRAHVVVYYVRPNNSEIVADAINFVVPGVLRTPVKVYSDEKITKPGANVKIEVVTKSNAVVGLLGIDQSVLLLKSGNDITEQDIIDEADSYFPGVNRETSPWYRRKKRSFWWPGSTTAGEIFDDSGLVILTNGLVHRYIELIMYRMNSMTGPMDADFSNNVRYAGNGMSSKSGQGFKVRKNFPETWLWNLTSANSEGKCVLSSHIPDTITSWIVSAFAMDSVTGLGIAHEPAKVTVFRSFFVKLNLPYSVLRGESVAIQAIVFNYNNKPVEAQVTLENKQGDFNFVTEMKKSNDIESDNIKKKTKSIVIPSQEGRSVSFVITPLKLGYIDIKISAVSSLGGDAVLRKLLVKPEGATQYFNKAVLVDLRDGGSKPITTVIQVDVPAEAVDGSTRVTVSAIGDILGPSVNNLEKLLQMPFGCGEQNMVNFVPAIAVTEYLSRANRLTPSIENKGRRFMESGYQRELTYKRDDGSFSAFGNRDNNGSTWLTAFVVRSFHQAKPHISIDDKVIEQSMQWLINRQKKDGSFEEIGEVHHKAMQGGAGSGAALTAFVLVALLENQAQKNYSQQVKRTEDYIIKELESSDDPYMVAIATYALHLSDNVNKDNAFQKLQSLAQRKGNTVYWTKKNAVKGKADNYYSSQSQDVEMTAYALLTYAQRADVVRGIPIMRWLISQQNENGGYSSTQDTVVGIQALGKLAARLVSSTISINIDIKYDDSGMNSLSIDQDNVLVLQRLELPPTARLINLEALGFGVGIVQVSWSYNLLLPSEKPSFSLTPAVGKASTDNYLELNVCTNYEEEGATNMAVMEIVLPSGFAADSNAFPGIQQINKVKQIDTSDGDSKVIIYFDRIDKEEICIVVPAYRNHKIANLKPVPVEVYDYYNSAKSARAFYEPKESKICDICDRDDCSNRCNSVTSNTDSSVTIIANSSLLLTVVILTLFSQFNK